LSFVNFLNASAELVMKTLKNKALFSVIIYIFIVLMLSVILLAPPSWKPHFVVLSEGLVGMLILLYGLVPPLDSPDICFIVKLHHYLHCNK